MAPQMFNCVKLRAQRQFCRGNHVVRRSLASPVTFVTDAPPSNYVVVEPDTLERIRASIYAENAKLAQYILQSAQQAGARQIVRERTALAAFIQKAAIERK